MNRFASYTTLLALATATPLFADITVSAPTMVPGSPAVRGNCDLLASNTVSATFLGLHDMTVQSAYDDAPTTVQVAVFQVIQPLGYKQLNRFGDGPLTAGTKFTVQMNKNLPGQPAENIDRIAAMQPGEEATMRIDHLYLLNGQQGEPLRVCSRLVTRNAPTAATPAPQQPVAQQPAPMPTSVAPIAPQPPAATGGVAFSAQSESVSLTRDAQGNMKEVRTVSKFNPSTGAMETHKYINGTEVDPQTEQPLTQPVAAPAPAQPAPAEQPKTDADKSDDTVVDRGEAPKTDAQQPAAPTEEEGF